MMSDLVLFLKNNLEEHFVIYFIPLYILGGRTVAIISAQLIGYGIWFLLPVVAMLDTLQIPIFYHITDTISGRPVFKKLRDRAARKEEQLKTSRFFRWTQVMGMPGVVTITMLPFKGCGMLSGFILTRLLMLPKSTGYVLMISGSILGCLIVLGLGEMILEFMEHIFK